MVQASPPYNNMGMLTSGVFLYSEASEQYACLHLHENKRSVADHSTSLFWLKHPALRIRAKPKVVAWYYIDIPGVLRLYELSFHSNSLGMRTSQVSYLISSLPVSEERI